ncbi:MAG TPA: energy transducer TonB [Longimicrobium sp.]
MRLLPILLSLAVAAPSAAQQPSADSTRVYELHEVEVLPRPQNAADFTAALQAGYPAHLREARVGGTVQVAFIVDPQGQPADVQVLSTPDSGFNAPTVQAVSLLRFTPAQVQGRAVPVRVEQPITWRAEVEADFVGQGATEQVHGEPMDGYELREVEELPRVRNGQVFQRELMRLYPRELMETSRGGQVIARFRIEEDGTITHARVTSTTDQAFVVPTLQALQVLRFVPARVNGAPVKVWVQQPIQWSLGGEGAPSLGTRPMGRPGEGSRVIFSLPPDPCRTSQC